jgi:hypothetical protein
MATNQLYQQMEKVRPTLQPWLNSFPVASNFVKETEVQWVGERDYRIPIKLTRAGRYGTVDTDGGAAGRGNAMGGDVLISSAFPTRMNFELTKKMKDATKRRDVAVASVLNDILKDGMEHMALQEDFSFHTDGTALIGTVSAVTTVSSRTVYTLDSNVGAKLIRRGQLPVIYATGYASIRSSSLYVYSVDYKNKKVTMSGTVPGAAATDLLCFEGVSSTGAAPTWKKGLGYFINSSTSSTILGVSQSTEPEMQSNFINVNGVVSWQAGMALLDQMDDRRPQVSHSVIGLSSRSQRAQIMIQEMQISRWDRGTSDKPIDMLPNIRMKSFPFCGVDMMIDPQLDNSKLIFWDPKFWGRARLSKLDWYETEGGQRFFNLYGGDGSPATAEWLGLMMEEDWYCFDIATTGLLYGLTLPTNY